MPTPFFHQALAISVWMGLATLACAKADPAPMTGVQAFRSAHGLPADGSSDTHTPAGDGAPNLLKYAFNLLGDAPGQVPDLTTPHSPLLPLGGHAGLPRIDVQAGTGRLQITYIRRKANASPSPGVTYQVQFSSSLDPSGWAENPYASESITAIDASVERVRVTDSLPAPGRRFARVTVSALPWFELGANGTLLQDGKPFFPFGFYTDFSGYTVAEALDELDAIADGGFTLVELKNNHLPNTPPYYPLFDLLDRAHARSLRVILATTSNDVTGGTLAAYKDHPALMAWELNDDGDDGRWTLAEAQARAHTVSTADPGRLTFLSLTGYSQELRDQAEDWCGVASLCGPQIYPIAPPASYGVPAPQALSEAWSRATHYTRAATLSGHAVLATLQTFSWGAQSPSPRYPTAEESRNMTYAALAAGAKGLIGYRFTGLRDQPELWAELQCQASEVAALSPVLLTGLRTSLQTNDPDLVATAWLLGDQLTVLLVNLSPLTARSVALPLPADAQDAHALFTRLPAPLSLVDHTLVGTLPPAAVTVYRLPLASP